jgi:hypothetical protein
MKQSAIDMENSENLLEGGTENIVYNSRQKYMIGTCCLFISYGMVFGLGFFVGYNADLEDGSSGFF